MTQLEFVYLACPHCKTWYVATQFISYHIFSMERWSDDFISTESFMPTTKELIGECKVCKQIFWVPDVPFLQNWLVTSYLQNSDFKENEDSTKLEMLQHFKENVKKTENLPSLSSPLEISIFSVNDYEKQQINQWYRILKSDICNTKEKEILIRKNLWQSINGIIRYKYRTFRFKNLKSFITELNYRIMNFNKIRNLHRQANLLYNSFQILNNDNLQNLNDLLKTEIDDTCETKILRIQVLRHLGAFKEGLELLETIPEGVMELRYKNKLIKKLRKKNAHVYKI